MKCNLEKYFIPILLLLSANSIIGQIQIVDSESHLAVSYAHVRTTNRLNGVISDFNGLFVLDSSFKDIDSVIISCIGYNPETILVSDLSEKKLIELTPSAHNLSEVNVSAARTKYQSKNLGVTKKPKKTRFPDYAGTAENGQEKAVWIPNDYSIPGYLKNINIYVSDLGYPDAHFRIHVYACNALETKPDKELTTSNIIASASNGNQWVSIDIISEQIQIGENGCFIGIEWFDSPTSKFSTDTFVINGYTWDGADKKDTIYSRIRSGNGAVLGAILQKYRIAKNKHWNKTREGWESGYSYESLMYTTDTMPDGSTYLRTPDNHYQPVLCINIDVSFPKIKVDQTFTKPKNRKLNKLENIKQNQFDYPQNSIKELFSSLIAAFENDDVIYALKYLCVYKEGQLNEVLSAIIDVDDGNYLSDEDKEASVKYLQNIRANLDSATLTKIDDKHFELFVDNETYHLVIDNGLWKINPYSYRIHK